MRACLCVDLFTKCLFFDIRNSLSLSGSHGPMFAILSTHVCGCGVQVIQYYDSRIIISEVLMYTFLLILYLMDTDEHTYSTQQDHLKLKLLQKSQTRMTVRSVKQDPNT